MKHIKTDPKPKLVPKNSKKLKGFKENLPTKTCASCGRLFQYRKKWKNCWDEV